MWAFNPLGCCMSVADTRAAKTLYGACCYGVSTVDFGKGAVPKNHSDKLARVRISM